MDLPTDLRTYGRTYGPTDGPTDGQQYLLSCAAEATQLKMHILDYAAMHLVSTNRIYICFHLHRHIDLIEYSLFTTVIHRVPSGNCGNANGIGLLACLMFRIILTLYSSVIQTSECNEKKSNKQANKQKTHEIQKSNKLYM